MRRILTVLAVVVVVAAIAVTGFLVFRDGPGSGARDDSVIAAVGEVEITEPEVDAVIASLRQAREEDAERMVDRVSGEPSEAEREQLLEQQLAGLDERLAADRERVIEMRILTEAGRGYAEQRGMTVPPPDLATVGDDAGLPEGHPYVRVVGEFFAVMTVLHAQVEPAEPTEADQREVYDHLVADGLTDSSFEEAQEVLTPALLGEWVGLRDLLRDVVDEAEVWVNPRYDPVYRVPVPMGEGGGSWLGVPLRDPETE